jgi:hypothetical protein
MTDKTYPPPDGWALALEQQRLRAASAQATPEQELAAYAANVAAEGLRVLEATSAAVADDVRNDLAFQEAQAIAIIDGVNYRPPDGYALALEKLEKMR